MSASDNQSQIEIQKQLAELEQQFTKLSETYQSLQQQREAAANQIFLEFKVDLFRVVESDIRQALTDSHVSVNKKFNPARIETGLGISGVAIRASIEDKKDSAESRREAALENKSQPLENRTSKEKSQDIGKDDQSATLKMRGGKK